MQTKKRAKPVKFGKAAREAELKATSAAAEKEAPASAPESELHAEKETHETTHAEPAAQPHSGELVDKLSDVPFETDFGTPSDATPAHPQTPSAAEPTEPTEPTTPTAHTEAPSVTPEPVSFSAAPTSPTEPQSLTEEQKTETPSVSAPTEVSAETAIPPIGRANEPIPFNPHETVFNTPPEPSEKKKNPFLFFLIIAFVAFVTGIAFMAGIYYAMPDKNFFAMPKVPAVPGISQPTPTTAPVTEVAATATPATDKQLADYTIRVLNGSGIRGEAAKAKAALEEQGFTVGSVGNADSSDVAKTKIVYKKTVSKDALTKLKAVLSKTYALDKETELPSSGTQSTDIVVTIGQDTAK